MNRIYALNKIRLIVLFIASTLHTGRAQQLKVGAGEMFANIHDAALQAKPGDTIMVNDGIFSGEKIIDKLRGTASAPVVLKARAPGQVIFQGGTDALHFTDPEYLIIDGFVFDQQTANGVNIDDGGTFDTPARNVIIQNCEWRGMNATGNNDELKLSGLTNFVIKNCRFKNGSKGGSLIDMVGCHNGIIEGNYFEKGGSNSIQVKGGAKNITIVRNRFINGGERAINIGGSTGQPFFRPLKSHVEASEIKVWANIFEGGMASLAFVGATNCEVINNTIVKPQKWVVRILQENATPGMLPCGNNVFRNNLVVLSEGVKIAVNVGPKTDPGSFIFSNNLWYNPYNADWKDPQTPTKETGTIVNVDPKFANEEFCLTKHSPAIGNGFTTEYPKTDFFSKPFGGKRSIGAVEYDD